MYGYLIALTVLTAVAASIVFIATFRQIPRASVSARLLLRLYLEVAALTGMLFFAVEFAGQVEWGLGEAFGLDAVYGSVPTFQTLSPTAHCAPPTAPICQPADVQRELWFADRSRRHAEDLARGAIFAAVAALFSAAHFALRRGLLVEEERRSLLRRAHLVVGLIVFGLATAIYLPPGISLLVDRLAYPRFENSGGIGVSLAFGISTLVVWLLYVALFVADLRPSRAPRPREIDWLSGNQA